MSTARDILTLITHVRDIPDSPGITSLLKLQVMVLIAREYESDRSAALIGGRGDDKKRSSTMKDDDDIIVISDDEKPSTSETQPKRSKKSGTISGLDVKGLGLVFSHLPPEDWSRLRRVSESLKQIGESSAVVSQVEFRYHRKGDWQNLKPWASRIGRLKAEGLTAEAWQEFTALVLPGVPNLTELTLEYFAEPQEHKTDAKHPLINTAELSVASKLQVLRIHQCSLAHGKLQFDSSSFPQLKVLQISNDDESASESPVGIRIIGDNALIESIILEDGDGVVVTMSGTFDRLKRFSCSCTMTTPENKTFAMPILETLRILVIPAMLLRAPTAIAALFAGGKVRQLAVTMYHEQDEEWPEGKTLGLHFLAPSVQELVLVDNYKWDENDTDDESQSLVPLGLADDTGVARLAPQKLTLVGVDPKRVPRAVMLGASTVQISTEGLHMVKSKKFLAKLLADSKPRMVLLDRYDEEDEDGESDVRLMKKLFPGLSRKRWSYFEDGDPRFP